MSIIFSYKIHKFYMIHYKFYTSSIQVLYKFYASSTQVLLSSVRMIGDPQQVLYWRDSVVLNAKVTGVYSGPVPLACEMGLDLLQSARLRSAIQISERATMR